uniref:Probable oxaloacetate decarboxylase gamma chain n=2 Tax=unclassified Candidatus Kentrum TaxID=2643149 RepID=A0A451B3W0_9GAMM|nr:MAG: oxaloacetate decarboxylase, gamma subunit [Candidatus Kentron sp. LPFa]VFK15781.1 MAG: oxaloacetate decarboxylase, gamma subunit [Candidatus Kentron sp. LPFa]VFK31080.1 MAG: oxaloacetate decarboxylase, gamma subunit [Candidatus Kentron sp. LPFa]VFK67702.1 MAG: oxaloacetate decarboxylase, gamma subunit [Candidatus Kentron sp. UNK]VFK72980.1 MAG: oxaloacetate decarboxylase, gamma subunit [Candidatus Kentron sp. UNK]
MTEATTINELLNTGVNLMLMGMCVVFILLGLLVVTMKGMSRLALALQGEPIPPEPPAAQPAGTPDQQLLSVISTAIHKYRRSRGK